MELAKAPAPATARVARERAALEASEELPPLPSIQEQLSVPSTMAPELHMGAPIPAEAADDAEPGWSLAAGEVVAGIEAARAAPMEEELEDAQVVRDMANHPMLDRVQKTLVETLEREHERTELELREKAHAVKTEKRRREDLGVELYGAQQQLAKLQLSLEAVHNEAIELQEARADEEVKAHRVKSEHTGVKTSLGEKRAEVAKNQAELDAINETLRQVEKYNEEMQQEIAVTKRATYKAEENVSSLEHAKKDQDVYIDTMHERIKRLEEAIAVHEAQLERQRGESVEARQMLTETGHEMDLISFEKKQLVQQWKASLVQLARRDEALLAAKTTLDSIHMETRDLRTELEGTRREVGGAKAEYEGLVMAVEKHKGDEAAVGGAVRNVAAASEALSAQLALLQRSMAHTDEVEAKITAEGKGNGESIERLAADIQLVTVERQKIEQKIAAAKSAQTTVSKAVKTVQKQTAAVKAKAYEKEIEEANLANELARIKVDTINTEAHNVQLRETLDDMVKKLEEQDSLITRYQQEIRQRNDDIEKKMYRVDRLNRKYEKMSAQAEEGEHLGPLEATIKNLTKERDAINAEALALQGQWLADQTKLVQTAQSTEETLEKNAALRAKARILDEKLLRLAREAASRASQIGTLESSHKAMRADVARLNDLLGRHATMEQGLTNETAILETEFKAELKELEEASLNAEQKTADARATKARLLDEVLEVERQILLWEKKIQLERETQQTLDPSVGAGEVKAMELEIHRMKLRLKGLEAEQETMIRDMERAILKKEGYALRYKGGKRPSMLERQGPLTKASLKKHMVQLRRTIQQTANDASQLTTDIQHRQSGIQDVTAKLAAATARYGDLEREAARLQAEINGLLYQKQRRTELMNARDRTASRFLDLERRVAPPVDDAERVERRFEAATAQNTSIRDVVAGLQAQFDYLAEPLDRIRRLADDAIPPPLKANFALSDD